MDNKNCDISVQMRIGSFVKEEEGKSIKNIDVLNDFEIKMCYTVNGG